MVQIPVVVSASAAAAAVAAQPPAVHNMGRVVVVGTVVFALHLFGLVFLFYFFADAAAPYFRFFLTCKKEEREEL